MTPFDVVSAGLGLSLIVLLIALLGLVRAGFEIGNLRAELDEFHAARARQIAQCRENAAKQKADAADRKAAKRREA